MKEEYKKQHFYALWQLDILIDIPIQSIINLLTPYVEFKGLIYNENQQLLYVDGIFIAGKSEARGQGYYETEFGVEEDIQDTLVEVIGTIYSNNDSLINKHLRIETDNSKDLDLKMYSYDEFIEVISKIGIPLFDTEVPIPTKQFIYNVQQVNQKSNFTVDEAGSIASNCVLKNNIGSYPQMTFEQNQLRIHNIEMLCECIKGQNQQGFHLITKELWCKQYCMDEGENSRRYDNGTSLKASAEINLELTIISKNEFIRWCEFMDIETGLTIGDEIENESIEFLKLEVERLQKLVWKSIQPPKIAPQQAPKPPETPQNNEIKVAIRTTSKTIMVSLGLMAWMLSENTSKLSRGGKPNRKAIEEAMKTAVSKLNIINPDDDNHGIVISNLNRDVSLGIKELESALKV